MIDSVPLLTAEEFGRDEPDAERDERWTELVAGRLVSLEPPDLAHGAIVLNLTKAIANYLQQAPEENGYACFELGLIVARRPDTVRRPAVSFFVGGQRFAELERTLTETRPALIVEVASTNDRRRTIRDRVQSYLDWGVRTIWVADVPEQSIHVVQAGRAPRILSGDRTLSGSPVFADFKIRASELFEMPG